MQMHAAVVFSCIFLSGRCDQRCDQRVIRPLSVNPQQILPAPLKRLFYSDYIESNKYTILAPDISADFLVFTGKKSKGLRIVLCTCLIYLLAASACEFADIVELLLDAGADPSIKDMEGSLPEEVTESSAISSLLRQYTAPKG